MSDPRLDALAEMARNRGLKLVRSRVRKPGKRRFGKVGLTDAKGKGMFGMDAKGPAATPDEVDAYLRNLGAKDWGASLDIAIPAPKTRPKRRAAIDGKTRPKRLAAPPPVPKIKLRDANASDAAAVAVLVKLLGHEVTEKGIRKRLALLARDKVPQLVAALDKQVVGLCGIDHMVAVHREAPVGRITILVISEAARGRGIGRMLVEAAEDRLRQLGCSMVEITSNDRLAEAHAFYRHMGYDRTSIRFCKTL